MTRDEWLLWRLDGIGSSDAPVIMGVSPYKTIDQLLTEKTSRDIVDKSNYITDLGNEMEPRIRSLTEILLTDTFAPELCEMEQLPFIRASLDGRSKKDRSLFIEIKLSGRQHWEGAKAGMIPEKYFPQIQHQFMVSGCQRGLFVSYLYEKTMQRLMVNSDKLVIAEVTRDEKYIEKLFEEECKFWELVKNKK